MLKKLEQLLLSYPTSTLVQTQWKFRRRQLEVVSVRDLVLEPLTPAEYLRRPLLHRGRWLVRAKDLRTLRVQQFYLASSAEFFRPTGLRLALYWPESPQTPPAAWLPGRFAGTRRDRIVLANALAQLRRTDFGGFDLRITVDRRTS